MNAGEDSAPVRHLKAQLADTFRVIHPNRLDVGTFGGFHGSRQDAKIDYVLSDPSVTVVKAAIIYDNTTGRYPSDHYPVTARIILPPTR